MARPRKWSSDAERMAAKRAAEKKVALEMTPEEIVHAQGVPVIQGAPSVVPPQESQVEQESPESPLPQVVNVAGAANKETLEEARAYGRLLGAAEYERTKSGHDYPGKLTRADRIARAEKYAEWAWREEHGVAA